MPYADINDIRMYYEEIGDSAAGDGAARQGRDEVIATTCAFSHAWTWDLVLDSWNGTVSPSRTYHDHERT